jgi:hypothetical protein
MDFQGSTWEGMDWIHLAEDVDKCDFCEDGTGPLGSIKCGELIDELRNC